MPRTSFELWSVLMVVAVAVGTQATAARALSTASQGAGDLTGAWVLNTELSDDPEKVMESLQRGEHGESSGGGHRPRGGFGGHGPGMHGGGGRGRGVADPEQMRARMWLLEPPGRLTITQTDSSITFTEGDGRSQTLTTTNRRQRVPMGDRTVDVRAKWDGERLVKEAALGDGMTLTETYSRTADTQQLLIVVKLEGAHVPRPVTFRRVYDAEVLP